jgi:type II secretory pathway pseudopilin PulG
MTRRFSLLEIMVVLIIIATAMAVVLPQIGAIPAGLQVSDTINTINGAMYTASGTALADGKTATLTINLGNQQVDITGSRSRDTRISQSYEDEQIDEHLSADDSILFDEFNTFPLRYPVELDPDTHYSGEDVDTTFKFYPNGEASGPEELVLLLAGRRFQVQVDDLTGRPQITELED